MEHFFSKFSLTNEKESFETIYTNIESGVVFRGTNLWILIFAIFVASLGLNVNSTAVIIGAMLISPLMGPIMGMGLSLAINDIGLLRKAGYNFGVAALVALATSTLFFLVSPINDAHSEILARTSPNVYDVLIALFGGLAGTLATASRNKGNVIPGVAIATALMPPLCTAGYGLATFQFSFFFGAFYLFVINTVFIALGTLFMSRVLKLPVKGFDAQEHTGKRRLALAVITLLTLLPSIYFAYTMIRNEDFKKKAKNFIAREAIFENDYLLSSVVTPELKKITLVYGGREIRKSEIDSLTAKLDYYNLAGAELEVKQGFAYLSQKDVAETGNLGRVLDDQTHLVDSLREVIQARKGIDSDLQRVFRELQAQYPQVREAAIQQVQPLSAGKTGQAFLLAILDVEGKLSVADKHKIGNWLKVRTGEDSVQVILNIQAEPKRKK
jgi:uncharacterized hydrophobic protein (TIGR00271 family)